MRPPPERPDLAEVFAALADPTRRRLLDHLAGEGPRTATQLAPEFSVSRQAVAKHLALLSDAGLLAPERRGREVRYGVVPDNLDRAAGWLQHVGARRDRRLVALERHLAEG